MVVCAASVLGFVYARRMPLNDSSSSGSAHFRLLSISGIATCAPPPSSSSYVPQIVRAHQAHRATGCAGLGGKEFNGPHLYTSRMRVGCVRACVRACVPLFVRVCVFVCECWLHLAAACSLRWSAARLTANVRSTERWPVYRLTLLLAACMLRFRHNKCVHECG